MEQLSQIYFQNEFKIINEEKNINGAKEFYYTKDFKVVKEVPEHRQQIK